MLLRHFLYFHCSNANMTFDKNFMKKASIFFQVSTILAKFYVLATVGI